MNVAITVINVMVIFNSLSTRYPKACFPRNWLIDSEWNQTASLIYWNKFLFLIYIIKYYRSAAKLQASLIISKHKYKPNQDSSSVPLKISPAKYKGFDYEENSK